MRFFLLSVVWTLVAAAPPCNVPAVQTVSQAPWEIHYGYETNPGNPVGLLVVPNTCVVAPRGSACDFVKKNIPNQWDKAWQTYSNEDYVAFTLNSSPQKCQQQVQYIYFQTEVNIVSIPTQFTVVFSGLQDGAQVVVLNSMYPNGIGATVPYGYSSTDIKQYLSKGSNRVVVVLLDDCSTQASITFRNYYDGYLVNTVMSASQNVPCPKCNDNKQNGDETGIDCGGSCSICGDSAPVASRVIIGGVPLSSLTGQYLYSDADGDIEGNSLYKWKISDSCQGAKTDLTSGRFYTATNQDIGKYLFFEVQPVAKTGNKNTGLTYSSDCLLVDNLAPIASIPRITTNYYNLNVNSNLNLISSYSYSDPENDQESGSQMKWFRADNCNGLNSVQISNANSNFYTATSNDFGKCVKFVVTPANLKNQGQASESQWFYVPPRSTCTISDAYGTVPSITPWQMHQGYEVSAGNPTGVVPLTCSPIIRGDVCEYYDSSIPSSTDPNWTNAPDSNLINFSRNSKVVKCLTTADYTYFQTNLRLPPGSVAPTTVTLGSNMNGIRVTIFNSYYPSGVSPPNGYVSYGGSSTQDIGLYLVGGEVNRLVVTLLDDCGPSNSLTNVGVKVGLGSIARVARVGESVGCPSCSNGIRDGDETAIDCGGNYCNFCNQDQAPYANNVVVSGYPSQGNQLTGQYQYGDSEGDPEGVSKYQWYRAADCSSPRTAISGAISRTYTPSATDKALFFEVTPVAAAGMSPGTPVQSSCITVTGNTPPIATSVGIDTSFSQLNGQYQYGDRDGDFEATSIYEWKRADKCDGVGAITVASTRNYTPTQADAGKCLQFSVTPVAASGASPGNKESSPWVQVSVCAGGAVAQPSSIPTRTPWQMHQGLEVTASNPDGVLPLTTCRPQKHGDICEYEQASIPPQNDAGWKSPPDPEIIKFINMGTSKVPTCQRAVDYTYFQTIVTLPSNQAVSSFTIAFNGMDDGSRITVFNSAYPNGLVVDGSYVFLGGAGTSDLKDYVVAGVNRIVVTQVDDCPNDNNLAEARVMLGGAIVSSVNAGGQPVCPTCNDKIRNGDELSVDCGGSCPACANNQPPTATPTISGTPRIGNQLNGQYIYNDKDGDPEGQSTYQWYRASDCSGAGKTKILGATSPTYTPVTGDKFLIFEVTPVAVNPPTTGAPSSTCTQVYDNVPPTADPVTISGNSNLLSGSYNYYDADRDPEGKSLYQWIRSSTCADNGTPIAGATSINYTPTSADAGQCLRLAVTPVAASGANPGPTAYSPYVSISPCAGGLSTPVSDVATRTPWQMHDGLEVTAANPTGVLGMGSCRPAVHGDRCEFDQSTIPPSDDSKWRGAPDGETINMNVVSRVPTCSQGLDYTYFQTFVTIPPGKPVSSFSIAFTGMDDGSRITVFNSRYPTGLVVDGSYVSYGGTGTSDLKDYVVAGEKNRIVVTQVDDCPSGNNLKEARVMLGGSSVSSVVQGQPATCPRCDDKIKNGDELSIDCGGSCPACQNNKVPYVVDNSIYIPNPRPGVPVTAQYQYADDEGDAEANSKYQWYTSVGCPNGGKALIPGATSRTYTPSASDKYLVFEVTPVAVNPPTTGLPKSQCVQVNVNTAPTAPPVTISPSNGNLVGAYNYYDSESDPEAATEFRWYRSDDCTTFSNPVAVNGVSTSRPPTYPIVSGDVGKCVRLGVTPVAATGEPRGIEALSPWIAITPCTGGAANPIGTVASRTPWQMHKGTEATASNPDGVLTLMNCVPKKHGDICEYGQAIIPPVADSGWTAAPNGETIGFKQPSKVPTCQRGVDFTYFQTIVKIPPGPVSSFSIAFIGMDDGSRITVFNSAFPTGKVVDGSYVFYGGSGTSDLKDYVVAGEDNRVVVTQVDDCPTDNNLAEARVMLGGSSVSSVSVGQQVKCPTCNDGIKNGDETGVDCGGSCPACRNGQPPYVPSTSISSTPREGIPVTGVYNYADNEGDPEGKSTYKWYRGSDCNGNNLVAIPGATSATYTPTSSDKYLYFEVTPVAVNPPTTGTPKLSACQQVFPQNSAPSADPASISLNPKVPGGLVGNYNYYDVDGDQEGSSVYVWQRADKCDGTAMTTISGQTSTTYTTDANDAGKCVRFGVTPIAKTGVPQGPIVYSSWIPVSPCIGGNGNGAGNLPSRTPWQMHYGLEVNSYPNGVVPLTTCKPTKHGEICEYDSSTIPAAYDNDWVAAPNGENIGMKLPSKVPTCFKGVDFTYFQTFVTIPAGQLIPSFSIDFSGMDDGSRITVFNTNYPNGIVVSGSYVFLGGSGTSDLKDYVKAGEVNRIVVTQVDDCPVDNNLAVARVMLGGSSISSVSPGQGPVCPTCSDGIRNGDEMMADCGGSCKACANNQVPTVPTVVVSGTPKPGNPLNGQYQYQDNENDPEGNSLYKWYRGASCDDKAPTEIVGATSSTYTPTANDKFLFFEVTPVARTGASPGLAKRSTCIPIVQNLPPTADPANINIDPNTPSGLVGQYNYNDVDNDPEGTSLYRWQRSDKCDGTGTPTDIGGATTTKYTAISSDAGKCIRFGVTPIAKTGEPRGPEVFSPWVSVSPCLLGKTIPAGTIPTRTRWIVHKGLEETATNPTGVLDLPNTCQPTLHGEVCEFSQATIPTDTDPKWQLAPNLDTIGYSATSNIKNCLKQVDYTYFSTIISVPNIPIQSFRVSFNGMDDGARVSVFNQKYNGLVVAGSYVMQGATGTADLSQYIVQGFNKIVITLVDDCGNSNKLPWGQVIFGGYAIPVGSSSADIPCSTCNDKIQNGDEKGVDCGGSCPACVVGCTYPVGSVTTQSAWQMYKKNVLVSLNSACAMTTRRGDQCEYEKSVVPADSDLGWENAPNLSTIGFTKDSLFSSCKSTVSFVYFQTILRIPTRLNSFYISFKELDDAARVTIYNTKGDLVQSTYLTYGASSTVELRDYLQTGDYRIVITLLDDCASTTSLTSARFIADGLLVPVVSPIDVTVPCPSCKDGIQNGDETSVDCGGSCPACVNNVVPTAIKPDITGTGKIGDQLYGEYIYGDAEGDLEGSSNYKWTVSDTCPDPKAQGYADVGNQQRAFTPTASLKGKYVYFTVTPVAKTGASPGLPVTSNKCIKIGDNLAPLADPATIVPVPSGSLWDLNGNYNYRDTENDKEGKSEYKWLRADNCDIPSGSTLPPSAKDLSVSGTKYTMVESDIGKSFIFQVTPVAATGEPRGPMTSTCNSPPRATSLTVSDPVGSVVTGGYYFNDVDGDLEDVSRFKWYRTDCYNSKTVIANANSIRYTTTKDDEDKCLLFCVVPIAKTGVPQGPEECSPQKANCGSKTLRICDGSSCICKGASSTPTLTPTVSPFPRKDFSWKPWVWVIVASVALGTLAAVVGLAVVLNRFRQPQFGAFPEDNDLDSIKDDQSAQALNEGEYDGNYEGGYEPEAQYQDQGNYPNDPEAGQQYY